MQSECNIRAMMRHLFLSDCFRSEQALYAKVKSPAEHVVAVARLVGDFTASGLGHQRPGPGVHGTWARS